MQRARTYTYAISEEQIEAILANIPDDDHQRSDGRIILRACLDTLYSGHRVHEIRGALAGVQGKFGQWLSFIGGEIYGTDVLNDMQRGQLFGAFSMACAFLCDIKGATGYTVKANWKFPQPGQ